MTLKKNFLSLLSVVVIASSLYFPSPTAVAYSQTSAQTYLLAHASSPWGTMGLAALNTPNIPSDYLKNVTGTAAIDYEAPILAISALGQNPKTFSNQDLVAKLKSFYTGSQLGDPSALNDDIFGILALKSSGLSDSDAVIQGSENFIFDNQNSDGGWGYSTGSPSDSNTTASAITALVSAGTSSADAKIQTAINYLKTAQNSDGGFTYDPKSAYGTNSDSSSTAWVIWALNSLGISPSTWSKGSNTPISYLEANQDTSGYFKFQSSSSEDGFSPVTTAYAVIALTGHTLPLIATAANISAPTYGFRIEGSNDTICSGQTQGPTALDVVKNASVQCGFTYHIKDTSFGPYLDQINSDTAAGQIGWMYLINYVAPSVGAADYNLKTGDEVLWYFGDFSWKPSRLTLSQTEISTGQSAQAIVEYFNNGSWAPLAGATITAGVGSFSSDASGQTSIAATDGYYKVLASKTGFIRSNQILLKVGQPSASVITLSANVNSGQVQGTSTQDSSISFSVNANSLDFGTLAPGSSSTKQITITNTGSGSLQFYSAVSGDGLFTDNLQINGQTWQKFTDNIAQTQNKTENVKLTVPQGYSGGQKSGQMIFWAQ